MEFSPNDMLSLAELLRPPEPEVIQGDDLPKTGYEITSSRNKPAQPPPPKGPSTIEEYEEQLAEELDQPGLDGRKEPEYSMHYQQAVSAEDVYLQMGMKTPGSASCERMILRIRMPGDKRENVDLSLEKSRVSVLSSRHKLCLPLPHEVDPDQSKAEWDTANETLTLNLKLDREFDYINF